MREIEGRDCYLIKNFEFREMRYRFFGVLMLALLLSCGNGNTERVVESYPNGQPSLVQVYDHNGQWIKEIQYYESGALMMEGAIKNGLREGEWKSYFEDGKTQSTGFFHEGIRTGATTIYYENGNLYMEGPYKDGRQIGQWSYYDEQGYLLRIDDYGE